MGETDTERVIVVLDLFDNLTKKIDKAMKQSAAAISKVNKPTQKLDKIFDKTHKKQKDLKRSTLGAMFAFRKLSESLSNLFKPAADALGIFDLWNTTLQVLFLPILLAIIDPLIYIMTWFMELPEPVKLVVGAVLGLTAILLGLSVMIVTLTIAFGALSISMLPITLTILAIVAAVIAVIYIIKHLKDTFPTQAFKDLFNLILAGWDWIKDKWKGASEFFSNLFTNSLNGIKSAWATIKGFFADLWKVVANLGISALNGVLGGLESMINFAIAGLNTLIKLINKIPGVKIPTFGNVSIPKIPAMAEGGIVTKPTTALIGEAGPEAVVPLSKMGSMGTTINQYNTINVMDKAWIMQIIEENNRKLLAEIRRNSV